MEDDRKYIGFKKRFAAFMIDYLPISIIFMTIAYNVGGTFIVENVPEVYSFYMAALALYFIIFPVTPMQGTPGKYILNIKIINHAGNRISLIRSIVRFLGEIVSYTLFGLGYIMIAVLKKSTGLHDLLAGTYVVQRKNGESRQST
ncbi:MAG: RDD family protein [Alkalicoccus sp.]|nr:MAG: RDD family protein [Alkalicoccus sp.]